jgi:hypothetical protein
MNSSPNIWGSWSSISRLSIATYARHENPSIGVLLCASKDNEVVEYALSRAASPALIAEYKTRLPDRRTLQRKLHEFYELAKPETRIATKGALILSNWLRLPLECLNFQQLIRCPVETIAREHPCASA